MKEKEGMLLDLKNRVANLLNLQITFIMKNKT